MTDILSLLNQFQRTRKHNLLTDEKSLTPSKINQLKEVFRSENSILNLSNIKFSIEEYLEVRTRNEQKIIRKLINKCSPSDLIELSNILLIERNLKN